MWQMFLRSQDFFADRMDIYATVYYYVHGFLYKPAAYSSSGLKFFSLTGVWRIATLSQVYFLELNLLK